MILAWPVPLIHTFFKLSNHIVNNQNQPFLLVIQAYLQNKVYVHSSVYDEFFWLQFFFYLCKKNFFLGGGGGEFQTIFYLFSQQEGTETEKAKLCKVASLQSPVPIIFSFFFVFYLFIFVKCE